VTRHSYGDHEVELSHTDKVFFPDAGITKDELDNPKLGPQSFTIANSFRRMGQREDPWQNMHRKAVSIQTTGAIASSASRTSSRPTSPA